MGKLHQVIAVLPSKKKQAADAITLAYHKIQKPALFEGISRSYRPRNDDGERLPPESQIVQVRTNELLVQVSNALAELFDVAATQDVANCAARTDVSIDEHVLIHDVPVTHLLFLEKQLNDLVTFVSKLPVLDPSVEWHYDQTADCYATEPVETARNKKIEKPVVMYEATKEHPAQVAKVSEDILAGYWSTIKFSGSIQAKTKNDMLARVVKLREAVISARESANSIDAQPQKVGKAILDYLFFHNE